MMFKMTKIVEATAIFSTLKVCTKGSPMNPKIVNIIHTVGFLVPIALLLVVTYNDIARLVGLVIAIFFLVW